METFFFKSLNITKLAAPSCLCSKLMLLLAFIFTLSVCIKLSLKITIFPKVVKYVGNHFLQWTEIKLFISYLAAFLVKLFHYLRDTSSCLLGVSVSMLWFHIFITLLMSRDSSPLRVWLLCSSHLPNRKCLCSSEGMCLLIPQLQPLWFQAMCPNGLVLLCRVLQP